MKRKLLRIAVLILLCIFSACIVKPEYIAESALIPRQPVDSPFEPEATPESTIAPSSAPSENTESGGEEALPAESIADADVSPAPVDSQEPIADPSADGQDAYDAEASSETGYFYSLLTPEQQRYYRTIKQIYDDLTIDDAAIHTDDLDGAMIAYNALTRDYAKYYYTIAYWFRTEADGQNYIEKNKEDYGEAFFDDCRKDLETVDGITDAIIAGIPSGATEYETVKYFFVWLCENVSYESSDRDQYITSAFIDRKSVCNGYARAFQYLCNKVGIQCAFANGIADNGTDPAETHAWNLVRIDGQYYWVDTTWGDPVTEEPSTDPVIDYFFLCTTDDFLFRTHTLEPATTELDGKKYQADYPECVDESLLYSKQFGLFFDSYDEETVGNAIIDYLKSGREYDIVLQFRYPEDCSRFVEELLPNIFEKLWNSGLTGITSYSSPVFYERDGYMELIFK